MPGSKVACPAAGERASATAIASSASSVAASTLRRSREGGTCLSHPLLGLLLLDVEAVIANLDVVSLVQGSLHSGWAVEYHKATIRYHFARWHLGVGLAVDAKLQHGAELGKAFFHFLLAD